MYQDLFCGSTVVLDGTLEAIVQVVARVYRRKKKHISVRRHTIHFR